MCLECGYSLRFLWWSRWFGERFVINEIKGVKPMVYNLIKRSNEIQGQYRTYDYLEARKSAVFLEPIRVFTDEN